MVERVLGSSLHERAAEVLQALRAHRPITSYAALAAAAGVSEGELSCLLLGSTLFSGRDAPDFSVAPQDVQRLFGEESVASRGSEPGVAASAAVAGQPWWIAVDVTGRDGMARRLRAEVIVTFRADRPFGVLDRRWLDSSAACS